MEIIGNFDKRDFVRSGEQKSACVGCGNECNKRNGDGKYRLQTRQVKNFL